jgi:hypothetical protein
LFTLWILILGFKNAAGTVTLNTTGGQPVMQDLATYRTSKECDGAAQIIYPALQNGGVAVNAVCLPTGISDPVAHDRPTSN